MSAGIIIGAGILTADNIAELVISCNCYGKWDSGYFCAGVLVRDTIVRRNTRPGRERAPNQAAAIKITTGGRTNDCTGRFDLYIRESQNRRHRQ